MTVGLVQEMTTGEAEKLLTAKGYLKSRHQAMIGAKVPGRVEKMLVEEGSKVKKGDVLAVLEHNELKAILAAARRCWCKPRPSSRKRKVDLKQKEREAEPRRPAPLPARMVSVEEMEKADAARAMAAAKVAALEAASS